MTITEMYDTIVEQGIATFSEIELVTNINGYNKQTLNDIVYAKLGMQTLEQYLEMTKDQI